MSCGVKYLLSSASVASGRTGGSSGGSTLIRMPDPSSAGDTVNFIWAAGPKPVVGSTRPSSGRNTPTGVSVAVMIELAPLADEVSPSIRYASTSSLGFHLSATEGLRNL